MRGKTHIRELAPSDVEAVVALALRAWASVFESFRHVLGDAIFARLYPDWRVYQADAVRAAVTDPTMQSWVAVSPECISGFVTVRLHRESLEGEIYMVAVDPAAQGAGCGSALTARALDCMRAEGMNRANVGTGGDPGHAAARATYEKAGFTALPTVQYFKLL